MIVLPQRPVRKTFIDGLLTASLALFASLPARAAPPQDLDAYSARVLQTFDVPGMALSIVEDGKTVFAKGYGVRELGRPQAVDERTIFPIGSNTKAFTATALAILADRGRIGWDDRVIDHLPAFRMWDAYVTREMTIRDLLVHHSGLGLGAGDLLFAPETTFTRDEIVERLRYIEPKTSFRSGFAYDNILYVVAGQVVAAVADTSWDDFVRRNIFEPLDMADSVPTSSESRARDRTAVHAKADGPVRGLGPLRALAHVPSVHNVAAAGGIGASATDMARWLAVHLEGGAIPGSSRRLFSAEQGREMLTPQTLIPVRPPPPPLAQAQANFRAYALGWTVQDYRGHKIASHTGGVLGAVSLMVLLPEKHVGLAVLTNAEEDAALRSIAWKVLDHYLDAPSQDWIAANDEVRRAALAAAQAELQQQLVTRASDTHPSLPLPAYAGVYRDPWYGDVIVRERRDGAKIGLEIEFSRSPGMTGALEPWQYDTFRTRWQNPLIEDAYVTFSLDAFGRIARATLQPVSPLADFSFDYQDLRLTPVRAQ